MFAVGRIVGSFSWFSPFGDPQAEDGVEAISFDTTEPAPVQAVVASDAGESLPDEPSQELGEEPSLLEEQTQVLEAPMPTDTVEEPDATVEEETF